VRHDDDYLNHLLDHIAEAGVTVQHITGDDTHPSYTHTVGLTTIGHPELVVTGLEPEDAGPLLNTLGHDIACHGVRPALGRYRFPGFEDVPEVPEFWLLPLYRVRRRLWTAVDLYGGRVDGWQLVWPDEEGRFPWDDGYHLHDQPLFCRAPYNRDRLAGAIASR
jgi:hypothetical protein